MQVVEATTPMPLAIVAVRTVRSPAALQRRLQDDPWVPKAEAKVTQLPFEAVQENRKST